MAMPSASQRAGDVMTHTHTVNDQSLEIKTVTALVQLLHCISSSSSQFNSKFHLQVIYQGGDTTAADFGIV